MTVTRYNTSGGVVVEKLTDEIFTSRQAARFLNVHINTLRRLANSSILPCYRIGPRGDRRFKKRDIERFILSGSSKIHH